MKYHFQKELPGISFDQAIERVTGALRKEGFGVLTEIDVAPSIVDFRKYRILGACNPAFAHRALQSDLHAGTMLPCNVVVMENDHGNIDISIIDPVASMLAIDDKNIQAIASEVREKMEMVINGL